MIRRIALVTALTAFATAGSAQTGMSVQEQMKTVVDPAAIVLFAVGGEVDPENGPDAAKVAAARWREGGDAAAKLKAAADALLAPANLKDGGDWKTYATQMQTLSTSALAAAGTKDGKAMAAAANGLGDTCSACHAKYKKQG